MRKACLQELFSYSFAKQYFLRDLQHGTRQPQSTGAIFASFPYLLRGENHAARLAGVSPQQGTALPSTGKHRLCHDMKAGQAKALGD